MEITVCRDTPSAAASSDWDSPCCVRCSLTRFRMMSRYLYLCGDVKDPLQGRARAERMTMPLARQVVKDLAVEHGACIRPIQLRRTNLDTGEVDQVLVPCGHTLAHACPSCAERARTLRAVQCREGWQLEDEPDLTPDAAIDDQQWWITMRADAQQSRDQAKAAGQDTLDFDELIRELDEEITRSGVRGNVAPGRPARRHRSTRRRQDAPDLPKRRSARAPWGRRTPRRTARRSAPRCSSR